MTDTNDTPTSDSPPTEEVTHVSDGDAGAANETHETPPPANEQPLDVQAVLAAANPPEPAPGDVLAEQGVDPVGDSGTPPTDPYPGDETPEDEPAEPVDVKTKDTISDPPHPTDPSAIYTADGDIVTREMQLKVLKTPGLEMVVIAGPLGAPATATFLRTLDEYEEPEMGDLIVSAQPRIVKRKVDLADV